MTYSFEHPGHLSGYLFRGTDRLAGNGQLNDDTSILKRLVTDVAAFDDGGTVVLDSFGQGFREALRLRPRYADAQNNLGYALLQKGRLKDAEQHFQKAVELNAGMGQAHHNLALCLYSQGRVAEALARYETAIKTDPRQLSSINNLAWILATTTEASLRDGARALELAQQANALTGGADATVLHTLAAALAENGQFPEAVATAEASLQRATAAENGALAEAVRDQLRAYRLGQPYREAAPAAVK